MAITHVCFIALTLARSLKRCFNNLPISLVFKQHPRDPANVNAWKKTCVIPILSFDTCVLLKDHNAVTPVRLEPVTPWSRAKKINTFTHLNGQWGRVGYGVKVATLIYDFVLKI